MNDYLALELIRQRGAERREEARRAGLARTLRLARRRRAQDDAPSAALPCAAPQRAASTQTARPQLERRHLAVTAASVPPDASPAMPVISGAAEVAARAGRKTSATSAATATAQAVRC